MRVVELRVDRVGLLVDNLDAAVSMARERLDGTSDDELLWEPVDGALSVRPAGAARTENWFGRGDWVLERGGSPAVPGEQIKNAATRTIAWLVNHTMAGCEMRWEWSFGARSRLDDDLEYHGRAAPALDALWTSAVRLARAVESGDSDAMAQIGFGQFPRGLDPQVPFLAIVWWQTREVIHHMAEAALLRDLYAARP